MKKRENLEKLTIFSDFWNMVAQELMECWEILRNTGNPILHNQINPTGKIMFITNSNSSNNNNKCYLIPHTYTRSDLEWYL